MLKKLAFSGLFGLILLAITFLLGEAVLRIYNAVAHSHIFYDGSYNRYRGKPHVTLYGYQLNAGGFSDTEFTVQPGDYRIVGLSDSFAFGIVPQNQTYLTKLEKKLKRQVGQVCLFNMGISQTNPTDYYTILTKEGADLKPDLVLLSFFVGNDFDVPRRPWFRHSYMLMALNCLYKVSYQVKDFAGHQPYCDSCDTFGWPDYLRIEKERLDSWMYHVPENGQYPGGQAGSFDQTVNALLRTRDYCKTQGAKFRVVIIPDELQVDASLQRDLVSAYYAKAGKLPYDVLTPTRRLTQRLRENQISYIDLYETFRKAVAQQQLYKPSDSHWNVSGNEFAAQLLADSLAKVILQIARSPGLTEAK